MMEDLFVVLWTSPRIEQVNIEIYEILYVPSHKDQIVLKGYRCDVSIGCGRTATSAVSVSHKTSPHRSRPAIKGQDASLELPG